MQLKLQLIKGSDSGNLTLINLKLIVYALFVSGAVMLSMMVFAALVTYSPIDIKYANVMAMLSFYIGSFISGLISGKNGKNNGWLKGLISATVYIGTIFIVSMIITSDFTFSFSRVLRILSALIVGSIGGIFGVNLK